MKEKQKQDVWRWKGEHCDTMLWQYCVGLLDLANSGAFTGNTELLDKKSQDKFDHIAKMFGLPPSFKVKFIYSTSFEAQKIFKP